MKITKQIHKRAKEIRNEAYRLYGRGIKIEYSHCIREALKEARTGTKEEPAELIQGEMFLDFDTNKKYYNFEVYDENDFPKEQAIFDYNQDFVAFFELKKKYPVLEEAKVGTDVSLAQFKLGGGRWNCVYDGFFYYVCQEVG